MVAEDDLLAGRYHIQDDIARGGMGRVIAAHDERLHRQGAVKVLKDELVQDPRFVERFRREARARAARIAAQVCNALAHAHAAGVVHRDIKPANIIIGASDRVKVTDFGIARAVGDSTLTATGSMLGTAHYISPEQAAGSPAGPSSDIYSTGIVLYEMLVGTVPFTGDSPVAIAMRHMADERPPPSTVNPGISLGFDEIVRRATSKDASDRFPDAQAMADALRRALDSSPGGLVGGATGVALGGSTAVL